MKCELTIITVILHHIKGLLEREMRLQSRQFRALQSGGLCVCDQVMLVNASKKAIMSLHCQIGRHLF